ncbi:unnamed protein product [Parnassius apollo]|uniref:(apollo) hypothetical protein n=1 Tax=Parnassius apollo TaxID=110799 RepID=A0A8S3XL18_PARAO|nr:unnamed protein product [Parnassius apollo]
MSIFRVFLLLVLSTSALSDGGSLLRSCEIKDIECLSKSTEQFLEKTCKGIPDYDIRAIDPLEIPFLNYKLTDDGSISLHFTNLRITGLRNQTISDFQMDKTTKSVVLKLNVDLNIVGEITIESSKQTKSFSGLYSAKATTLATANYEYDLVTDSNGVQHFKVLPERISCEIVGEPEVSISDDLLQAIQKEESYKQWRSRNAEKQKEIREKTLCKLVETAYVTVVHNIRAAAKFLPANAFFKDI